MSCPGLHCPGCTEGQSLGIVAAAAIGLVLADELVPWVAERVFWIGGTIAVCFVLAVAASMWLETRADRRGRAWGAARGIYSRADCIAAGPVRQVIDGQVRPAIAPHVTINGQVDTEQARVIRQAIDGGN
jgi:MFS family permease